MGTLLVTIGGTPIDLKPHAPHQSPVIVPRVPPDVTLAAEQEQRPARCQLRPVEPGLLIGLLVLAGILLTLGIVLSGHRRRST